MVAVVVLSGSATLTNGSSSGSNKLKDLANNKASSAKTTTIKNIINNGY